MGQLKIPGKGISAFKSVIPTEMIDLSNLDKSRIYQQLWASGQLSFLTKGRPAQGRAYEFIHSWKESHQNSAKPILLNNHRAWGKSWFLCMLGIERCIKYPGQEVRFAAPSFSQCEEIVEPNIDKIKNNLYRPDSVKIEKHFDYYEITNLYNANWKKERDPRPSFLRIIGCRERADSHRGKRSHMVLMDECRDIDDFDYVARVIFGPHFATMENPYYVMSTTPPETTEHPWVKVWREEAIRDGRYFECPVTNNPGWTAEDNERMKELFGDEDSIEWQREMLCKCISDPTRLVIPEFADICLSGRESDIVVNSYPRPEMYHPMTCLDFGYQDYTAAVFCYIDWLHQLFIVEDELWVHRKNSAQLKNMIEDKERQVFAGAYHQIQRHGDMTPQQQADLAEILGFVVIPVDKTERSVSIVALRDTFRRKRIRIVGSKCKNLIRQIKGGTYEKNLKDFNRHTGPESMGHLDLLAALIYAHRKAPWLADPYPEKVMKAGGLFAIKIEDEEENSKNMQVISEEEYILN